MIFYILKKKELLAELMELRDLKSNFEAMHNQIKEGAIETIMEKENELLNLKEKLVEQEIYYKEQIERSIQEIRRLEDQLIHAESHSAGLSLEDGDNEVKYNDLSKSFIIMIFKMSVGNFTMSVKHKNSNNKCFYCLIIYFLCSW